MMFKITCKTYHIVARNQRGEFRLEIKPRFLKNESGFVNAVEIKVRALSATKNGIINVWTKHNGTVGPDVAINADDVFAIEVIKEEEK